MTKKFFNYQWMFALALGLFLASCSSDDSVSSADVENYTAESINSLQERGKIGKRGCYELVFPVTIEFPDGSTAEVEDYASMKEAIKEWKENNPDVEERPSFQYPIEVTTKDGEIVTVGSQEELMELRQECRKNFSGGNGNFCFKLVFPVTISFEDGSEVEVNNRRELKQAVREWKQNNPESEERPTLVFPIDIEFEDGTTQTVNSAEELAAIKEDCSN